MKKLSLILGILLFASIGYFAYLNRVQLVNFLYLSDKSVTNISLGLAIVAISVYSALATILICTGKIVELNERVKRHMRNAERASVETEESSDKVKNLQAKIDTLEIALKEALTRK